jgi:hypothetical protein
VEAVRAERPVVAVPVLVLAVLTLLCAHSAGAATVMKTLRDEVPGAYAVDVTYPQFTDATPLARLASRTIEGYMRADVAEFKKAARETLALPQRPPGPYSYDGGSVVTYAVPTRLLSTVLDVYKFSGGAHGNAWYVPFNFGVVDGRVKRLVLGDLFLRGSSYQRLVSDAVIARLKKTEGALWVQDGTMRSLSVEQLNRFSISPTGLTFLLNHYEAGPYASGRFEVALSITDLGPNFKRALILAR